MDTSVAKKRVQALHTFLYEKWRVPKTRTKRFGFSFLFAIVPGGATLTLLMNMYLIKVSHDLGIDVHTRASILWRIIAEWMLCLVPIIGPLLGWWFGADKRNFEAVLSKM